jgi:hypothetical protein
VVATELTTSNILDKMVNDQLIELECIKNVNFDKVVEGIKNAEFTNKNRSKEILNILHNATSTQAPDDAIKYLVDHYNNLFISDNGNPHYTFNYRTGLAPNSINVPTSHFKLFLFNYPFVALALNNCSVIVFI